MVFLCCNNPYLYQIIYIVLNIEYNIWFVSFDKDWIFVRFITRRIDQFILFGKYYNLEL